MSTTSGGCPSEIDVRHKLAALVSLANGHASTRDVLMVGDLQDGGMHLELRGADGAWLAERDVQGKVACADRAAVAAAIAAAWELQLHPNDVAPRIEVTPTPAKPLAARGRTLTFDVLAGRSVEPQAWRVGILAQIGGQGTRLAWRVSGDYQLPRHDLVAGAQARWWRAQLAVGAALRVWPPVEVFADFVVSRLAAEGQGFSLNLAAATIEPGADVGFAVLWHPATQLRLGVAFAATAWLNHQALVGQAMARTEHDLPRVEVLGRVFAGFGR